MANELNMTLFSKRLKEARTDKNMTQKELSEKSGVSTVMISAYERSNTNSGKNPALNNIYAIATALGVSIDWLCGLTENTTVINDNTNGLKVKTLLLSLYHTLSSDTVEVSVSEDNDEWCYLYVNPVCPISDFIKDCEKLKEALKLDVLDNEMKQNLVNGVMEKYIKLSNNDIGKLFNDKDLPF